MFLKLKRCTDEAMIDLSKRGLLYTKNERGPFTLELNLLPERMRFTQVKQVHEKCVNPRADKCAYLCQCTPTRYRIIMAAGRLYVKTSSAPER